MGVIVVGYAQLIWDETEVRIDQSEHAETTCNDGNNQPLIPHEGLDWFKFLYFQEAKDWWLKKWHGNWLRISQWPSTRSVRELPSDIERLLVRNYSSSAAWRLWSRRAKEQIKFRLPPRNHFNRVTQWAVFTPWLGKDKRLPIPGLVTRKIFSGNLHDWSLSLHCALRVWFLQ